MEKLTIEQLAGYVPFALKIKCADTLEVMTMNGVSGDSTMEVVTMVNGEEMARLLAIDKSEDSEEYGIPLLLPLSFLTKEITHEGLTFVPLVSLFNLRFAPGAYHILCLNEDIETHDMEVSWDNVQSTTSLFYYNVKDYSFGLLEKSIHQRLPFQHQMFQKLHEWHFDIHGLIKKGLAIDKTL